MELVEGQNLNDHLEEYTQKTQAESGAAAIAAAAEEKEGRGPRASGLGPRAESTMAEQALGLSQVQVKEILRHTVEATAISSDRALLDHGAGRRLLR